MTHLTDFATLPELLAQRVRQTPRATAFVARNPAGRWRNTTWRQFHKSVAAQAARLWQAGLRPGDHVAVMLPNSLRWEVAQHAVYRIGGIVVGLDRNDPADRLADLFSRFKAKALILEDRRLLDRIPAATLASLRLVLTDAESMPVLEAGAARSLPDLSAVAPEQPATLIFTSGTTGRPKALVYSHRQLTLAIASILPILGAVPDQAHTVCWLPLANPFQRMTNWCAMAANWKSFMVPDPTRILAEVRSIRPHFLVAVPRFYEKLHAEIHRRLTRLPGRLQSTTRWAQQVGGRYWRAALLGDRVAWPLKYQYRLADRLVLRRVRRALGGRLRFFISGSAPLSETLLEAFAALGWPILEAYGISENIIPIAMNAPGACRPGSVGRPLAPNAVRIAEDGEILVKSPGVSLALADAQSDGFWRTGDLGRLDEDGFLRITGRKSDVFKLSTGRKIVPRILEEALGRIEGVAHSVAAGHNRQCVVALLNIPEAQWDRLQAQHHGAEGAYRYLREQARSACAHLPDYSRPAAVAVVRDQFSPQNGELTPNLKLRRDFVLKKHDPILAELYRCMEKEDENGK
jgi:long-chain acyl-CoA synthetase